jgi:hypothetical protein
MQKQKKCNRKTQNSIYFFLTTYKIPPWSFLNMALFTFLPLYLKAENILTFFMKEGYMTQ